MLFLKIVSGGEHKRKGKEEKVYHIKESFCFEINTLLKKKKKQFTISDTYFGVTNTKYDQ